MNIKKARPQASTRNPRAVNRGIRERVALRSSIHTALVRSRMVLSSMHSYQPEEILLQVFFLDQHLRGRNASGNQQASDVVRVFKRRGIGEFERPIPQRLRSISGGGERQASRLQVPRP